jgi:hypothetical protein
VQRSKSCTNSLIHALSLAENRIAFSDVVSAQRRLAHSFEGKYGVTRALARGLGGADPGGRYTWGTILYRASKWPGEETVQHENVLSSSMWSMA